MFEPHVIDFTAGHMSLHVRGVRNTAFEYFNNRIELLKRLSFGDVDVFSEGVAPFEMVEIHGN